MNRSILPTASASAPPMASLESSRDTQGWNACSRCVANDSSVRSQPRSTDTTTLVTSRFTRRSTAAIAATWADPTGRWTATASPLVMATSSAGSRASTLYVANWRNMPSSRAKPDRFSWMRFSSSRWCDAGDTNAVPLSVAAGQHYASSCISDAHCSPVPMSRSSTWMRPAAPSSSSTACR
ncbi:hypothetical protein ZEAMMB73_Zm00001d031616 [Zea mays]|uniref:Uncharacterized protein n=1 Tax=Zea mays TaxID=4577 RepID=A0A1D6KJV8_MAIZE|nr:hypothetical protein ZEAMMB73_Zm00001d031616 [Zea mays]